MKRAVAALLLGLLAGAALGQGRYDWPSEKVHGFGSRANRVNVLFVGDGYTAAELPQYRASVRKLVDGLFRHEPFRSYQNVIHITRLDVESAQSGTSYAVAPMPKFPTAPGTATGLPPGQLPPGQFPGLPPGPLPPGPLPPGPLPPPPPTMIPLPPLPTTTGPIGMPPIPSANVNSPPGNGNFPPPPTLLPMNGNQPLPLPLPSPGGPLGLPPPPTPQLRDTRFRSYVSADLPFHAGLLDVSWTRSELAKTNPELPRSVVVIVVNDDRLSGAYGWWGGSGNAGVCTVTDFTTQFPKPHGGVEVLVHELGHALIRLGDEYTGSRGTWSWSEPFNQNLTTAPVGTLVQKWKNWILAATPGIGDPVAGGMGYTAGIYHPKEKCMMNQHYAGDPFCEVCREHCIQRFYDNVSLVDAVTPAARRIELTVGASQTFTVNTVGPARGQVEGEWWLDRLRVEGTKRDSAHGPVFELTLGGDRLVPGQHTIRFIATDRTPAVLADSAAPKDITRRPNQRYWYVTVRDPGGQPQLRERASN